jgi:NADH-quinone oxidoreductase subunit B
MGVEQKLGNMGVVTVTLEQAVNWSRTNAMWPMLFGLACCAIEMMSAQAADYDMSRFGMELMRPSPRQSDLMIVAGRVSRKMAPVLRRLYDQMPDPKWVVAMGDCCSCGGVFAPRTSRVDDCARDVDVAGCPRPALIRRILTLHAARREVRITPDAGCRLNTRGDPRENGQLPPWRVPGQTTAVVDRGDPRCQGRSDDPRLGDCWRRDRRHFRGAAYSAHQPHSLKHNVFPGVGLGRWLFARWHRSSRST